MKKNQRKSKLVTKANHQLHLRPTRRPEKPKRIMIKPNIWITYSPSSINPTSTTPLPVISLESSLTYSTNTHQKY